MGAFESHSLPLLRGIQAPRPTPSMTRLVDVSMRQVVLEEPERKREMVLSGRRLLPSLDGFFPRRRPTRHLCPQLPIGSPRRKRMTSRSPLASSPKNN
jgi:hypothetical protein